MWERGGEPKNMEKEQVTRALSRFFGHDSFRPGQWEIIQSIFAGRNTLAILATGGGKSLCYQLPALLLPGMTLVISPLISLMADQVQQLKSKGIQAVEYINSSLSSDEYQRKIKKVKEGKVKLLYLSPEKLQQESFLQHLAQKKVSLFVVDEAHCISQWGHDFRTDYQRLLDKIHKLGNPVVLALTATATPAVREDICTHLHIPPHQIIKQNMNRMNIAYDVVKVADEQAKKETLLRFLQELKGPGIVYFRSRQGAEQLCQWAGKEGITGCAYYHGGMAGEERLLIQQQFLLNELRIIFATNAFGMGIDKPDIRFVIHYHLPPDMESYIQEVGRIGRDGVPGYACLLYAPEDGILPGQLIMDELPNFQQIRDFLLQFSQLPMESVFLSLEKGKETWGMTEQQLSVLLFHLEVNGFLHRLEKRKEGWYFCKTSLEPPRMEELVSAINKRKQIRLHRLNQLIAWVEKSGCRREGIAHYFQEEDLSFVANCCSSCGIDYSVYKTKNKNNLEMENRKEWNWEEVLNLLLPISGEKRGKYGS